MGLSNADFEAMADDHSGKYDETSDAFELGHVQSTIEYAIRALKDGRAEHALNELENALARIDARFQAVIPVGKRNGR